MSVNLFFVSLLLSKDEKSFTQRRKEKTKVRKESFNSFAVFCFPLRETSLLFAADDLSREERNHYLVMPCD